MNYAMLKGLNVSPLIQISKFPDGLYVHDGHHRVVSTYGAGRFYLTKDEYEITEWTYGQYLEINLSAGWYTPFDPRTHCRKPNLSKFKKLIRTLIKINPEDVEETIRNRFNDYCEPRRIKSVQELADESILCQSL